MSSRTGLGRGLGALIDVDLTAGEDEVVDRSVDIELIDVNPSQARKTFDQEKLNELADSIRENGIIQPLVLTERGGRYVIVAGERRYRAARLAGLKSVPAVIRGYSDEELIELSLIENIQREDLNPVEEAKALKLLTEEKGYTQEALSVKIGRSRSAIANSIRLLSLPEKFYPLLENGSLTAGHARALLGLNDSSGTDRAVKLILDNSLSVRETEDLVRQMNSPRRETTGTVKKKSAELASAENRLKDRYGTKVTISGNGEKGRISMEYYSKEQLKELFDILDR